MRVKVIFIFSALMLMGLSSCIKKPFENPVENLPPETYCFIAHVDTVDTVQAKLTLYWIGSDPDGEVVGYFYRIDNGDSVFTTKTSDTFTFSVTAGDTYAVHTFSVWAVDNEGLSDPTPSKVVIPVRNTPPQAFFIEDKLPPDTTLTVATFYFGATDIDGDQTIVGFYYRLDYEPDTLWYFVSKDSASVFLTNIEPGERTIYLIAVDESYTASDTVSHSWYVKPVHGRILLIDDAKAGNFPTGTQPDLFFLNFLDNYFGSNSYTVFRVENGLPYSFFDVDYMINNLGFELIIWYTGDQTEHFSNAINSFTTFLDSGKKLVLISPAVMNVLLNPSFTPSPFARNYMGVDSVVAWDKILLRNEKLWPQSTSYDTLQCSAPIISRFDGLKVLSSAKVLYVLPTIPARWSGNPPCIIVNPSTNPQMVFSSIQFYALNGRNNAEAMLYRMITEELRFGKR